MLHSTRLPTMSGLWSVSLWTISLMVGAAFGDGQAVAIHRCVTAARWTMIIGKDGRILNRRTDVSPVNDSQEVLEFIHKMLAK